MRLKLEALAAMTYEHAKICSKTKREVFEGRIENEGRIWRMREGSGE